MKGLPTTGGEILMSLYMSVASLYIISAVCCMLRAIHIICPLFLLLLLPLAARQPNVVFILADDVGYADLGVYGGHVPTPNLDKLAAQGMRFTDAHAPAALCAPSRFSLLTGSYPYRNGHPGGVWNISSDCAFAVGAAHLQAGKHVTVGDVAQAAGYRTAFLGKSHLGGDIRDLEGALITAEPNICKMDFARGIENGLSQHGFDYVLELPSGIQHEPFAFFENGRYMPINPAAPADNRNTRLLLDGFYEVGNNGLSEIVEHKERPGIGDKDYNSSQAGLILTRKAIEFIDNHQRQNVASGAETPFLLYFASEAIHVPHTPCIDFDGDPVTLNQPVAGVTGGVTSDFLYQLDLQVGAILQTIEDAGLAEDTLVIFTSDNGALWPEICDFGPEAHDNNGRLRDYKASVYEGGHRVPFIVKWPGRVQPGSVSDELVLGQDWVATLYELTGQPMDADQAMDSTSLIPLLLGEPLSQPLHPFVLYQAGFAYDGAIREGDMVLMVDRENEATELYDLGADLAQANNLIGNPEYAQLVARLQAKFLLHNDHDDATFGEPRTTAVLRVD